MRFPGEIASFDAPVCSTTGLDTATGATPGESAGASANAPGQALDATIPERGVTIPEPSYGLCLTRITDAAEDPTIEFARADYPRRQSFNADNTRMLAVAGDGAWHLYDPRTASYEKQLPLLVGAAEPHWHPDNPELLVFLPEQGALLQVASLNTRTDESRVVGDLRGRLQLRWPDASIMNTGAEGSPSADNRYWAFQVSDAQGGAVGLVVWDQSLDMIVATMDIKELPDHLSMSPSGLYVVVSWSDRTVRFDRQLNNALTLQPSSEHSDIAIGADGDDYYVSVDFASDAGDLFMTNLSSGVRTNLLPTYVQGRTTRTTSLHVSGKAYRKPGWVVVSMYNDDDPDGAPQILYQRIWLVQMQAKPKLYPLAFHRSRLKGLQGLDSYWAEPHASVNADLTRVIFNSNWNGTDAVNVFAIDVPLVD